MNIWSQSQSQTNGYLCLCQFFNRHFMIKISLQTAMSLRYTVEARLDMQTTCLNDHLHVMSHTFPQLIQTAAVAEVQILMTDLAYDMAAVWCHFNQLVRHGDTEAQPVSLVLQWLTPHKLNDRIFVLSGILNLWHYTFCSEVITF